MGVAPEVRRLAGTDRLLKALIDTEADCVKLLARDHTVLEMNRAGLAMIEADDRSQVIGRSVLPLIVPEHRPAFLDLQRRAFEGHGGTLEFDMVGLKGTRRSMETRVVPLRNGGNGVVAVLAVTRDVTGLKRAHAALRRGEALFRALVEHSNDAVVLLAADHTVQYAGPSVERVLGIRPQTLAGRSFLDLVHPEDLSTALGLLAPTPSEEGPGGIAEVRLRRDAGAWMWTELTAANLLNEPDVEALLVTIRDVTARREADRALRESERRFRRLAEHARDVIFRLQVAPRPALQFISPSVSEVGGYTSEEHYADPELLIRMAHPDDRAAVERILRRGEVPAAPVRLRWIRRDGATVWTEQTLAAVRDEQGRVAAVEGVVRDITDLVRAEEGLARALSLARAALESTTDGLLVVDLEGRIVEFNRRFTEMWRIPEEVLARRDEQAMLRHILDQLKAPEAFLARVRELAAAPEATARDTIECTDGRIFEYFSQPQRLEGVAVGRVFSFSDVTERRRAEEQLLQQLQTLTTLTASAQRLSQSLRVRELAEFVASTCVRMFDAALAWVGRADPDGTLRILSASPDAGYAETLQVRWDVPAGEETPSARALRTGFPVIVTRPEEALPPERAARFAAQGYRVAGAFPLISRNRAFGVLALYSGRPDFFEGGRADLYQAFAHQAAAALENARLFEESQRRADEFQALYETSQALAAPQDLDLVLETVLERATTLLRMGGGAIHLFDRMRGDLVLAVVRGLPVTAGHRHPLSLGVVGAVARERRPVIVQDYRRWEHRNREMDHLQIGPVVGVPMLFGGELVGVLSLNERAERNRRFTDDDVRLLTLFAAQAAGAVHTARLFEEARRRLEQLQALHDIDTAITGSMDVRVTLGVFLDKVTTALGVDAAGVLLLNEATRTLEHVAARGFRTEALRHSRLPLGRGYAGQAAAERRTIVIPDLAAAPGEFHRSPLLREEGFVTYMACPLIAKGQVRGVLELFHRSRLEPDAEWQAFLDTLTRQAAIAVDNATLVSDLQRANVELMVAYDTTLEGWSRALDLRDKETEGHTQRVTDLTLRLAREMGVAEEQLLHIRRGALLHDIGKMGIPDSILLKPGPLDEREWAIMRQHPVFAFQLLHPIPHLRQALDIPLCHHERWDGTGYPQGLAGEAIPLAARIFAVADVWDALRSDRPYRKAWSEAQAREYIASQAGKQFDPAVVAAFLRLLDAAP